MRSRRLHGWFAASAACFLAGNVSAAELTPNDIVVLFNVNSRDSLRIARYYMNARQIPPDHLLPIRCDAGEVATEEFYRTTIAPQVRKGLQDHNLLASVKCLVTTYDIPLKILARQPAAAELREIAGYKKQVETILDTLEKQGAAYDAILAVAPSTTRAASMPATTPAEPRTLLSVAQKLNTAATAAGNRISRAPEPAHSKALLEFIAIQEQVVGINGLLSSMSVAPGAPNADAGQARLNALSLQLREMDQQYQSLAQKRDQPEARKQMIELRRKSAGLIGQVRTIEEIIASLQPDNTESCLDSELAMILADPNYPRANWIANPKSIENYSTIQRMASSTIPQTLLVARLDGSTPAKIEEMIDTSIRVEATGLQGKFYVDARGLRGADAYAAFDGELRRTAEWVKTHSTIEVVLDDKPELFHAKDAPDAALYCGWYSLRNYQESAAWVNGAVGYHVASLEMLSLHNPKETGWTINLLNRGFAGTLGATDEPYLNAFPNPSLFFPLVLSGQFTQGEVWQITCPLLSWRIGYVGDPLYNPFKANPRVTVDQLKSHPVLQNAFATLRGNSPITAPK